MKIFAGPNPDLADAAARHMAGYTLGRILSTKDATPWVSLEASTNLPNMVLVPDLATGLAHSPNKYVARYIDQDGVTIPATRKEYGTKINALRNGSLLSALTSSILPRVLDWHGLDQIGHTGDSVLNIGMTRFTQLMPRNRVLARILIDKGFDKVLFGVNRNNSGILNTPLGLTIMEVLNTFITSLQAPEINLTSIFDVANSILPLSKDSKGGEGVFLRRLVDWLNSIGVKANPNMVLVNPLLSEPSKLDIGSRSIIPLEV